MAGAFRLCARRLNCEKRRGQLSLKAPRAQKSAPLASPRAKSGQISLEALVLSLVFLSLVGVSYLAVSRLYAAAQQKASRALSEQSFEAFMAGLNSACSLGSGNVRVVEVRGARASLFAQGKSLAFSAGGFFASANSSCELEVLQGGPARSFTIENRGGRITVS